MTDRKRFTIVWCALALALSFSAGRAQAPDASITAAGADIERVWHLGRVTGDLERIIAFYHDLLGLGLRGERNQPRLFANVPINNEFVNAPSNAEFRAAFMPIPGTSTAVDPQAQIYLEAFEYRNIDRHQIIPTLVSPGASSLRLLVRDLDKTFGAAKSTGVSIVTAGAEPVRVAPPLQVSGSARAIIVRDPDGYPVELMQVTPAPSTVAPDASTILGAHMSVVVSDLDASLRFYRDFIGADLQIVKGLDWHVDASVSRLRNVPPAEFRTAYMRLPGSAVILELLQYRGIEQTPYRPVFQDIGFGHVALIARDITVIHDRMNRLGIKALNRTGTWTQFSPSLRGIYTRDRDGFFLEVIERR